MKLLFFLAFLLVLNGAEAQSTKEIMYVGTFSVRGSAGIYAYEFDRAKGILRPLQTVTALESPSFLAVHPSGKYVYSVNRGALPEKPGSGSVSAYAVDRQTGKLSLLNHQPSYGMGPCHIGVDRTGKWAFVSNYAEGNLALLPILADGKLAPASDSVRHRGRGLHPQRQEKAHVHSAVLSPDNRFVYVSDLGTDKIHGYSFADGKLKPADKPFAVVAGGAGPRHFTFHPNGLFGYSAEELTSSVAAFTYDKPSGALRLIQDTVRALPADFTGANTSADIHTDPKGRFLYLSNRGHNSLTIFSIARNGKLTPIGRQETLGKTPRNFLVDPRGEYLFAANQDSDSIVIFRIDPQTGRLTDTGQTIQVPSPVSLTMVRLP